MDFQAAIGILHPTPPFDFEKSRRIIQWLTGDDRETWVGHRSLAKVTIVNRQPIFIRLKSAGTIKRPLLKYLLISEIPIAEETRLTVLKRISQYLSLYDNLDAFYRIGRQDHHFTPILKRLYGYHPVKFLTPFENACWALLLQHSTFQQAREMKRRLVSNLGKEMAIRNFKLRAFPEAESIVYANFFDISYWLKDEVKADALKSLAHAFAAVNEDFWEHAPYQAVYNWLLDIKGMSSWSAAYIMLHGFGHTDRAPLADRQLIDSVVRYYGRMIYTGLPAIAEQYGEWQGYWAHYLKVPA